MYTSWVLRLYPWVLTVLCFITDVKDLENKLLNQLSGVNEALDIKTNGKGKISWTTRGQQGI